MLPPGVQGMYLHHRQRGPRRPPTAAPTCKHPPRAAPTHNTQVQTSSVEGQQAADGRRGCVVWCGRWGRVQVRWRCVEAGLCGIGLGGIMCYVHLWTRTPTGAPGCSPVTGRDVTGGCVPKRLIGHPVCSAGGGGGVAIAQA